MPEASDDACDEIERRKCPEASERLDGAYPTTAQRGAPSGNFSAYAVE